MTDNVGWINTILPQDISWYIENGSRAHSASMSKIIQGCVEILRSAKAIVY